jgi:hypothetical protein
MANSNTSDKNKRKMDLKDNLAIVYSILSIAVAALSLLQLIVNIYDVKIKTEEDIETCSYNVIININN